MRYDTLYDTPHNTRLERTRHQQASLLSCVGEPLKRNVIRLSSMKCKVLKSIAHNFSHSFVGYTNYFDDGHVVDDLLQLARKANGERISIQWIPGSPVDDHWPPRVLKSIAHYKARLPEHVKNSGARLEVIREFHTDIF